MAARTAATNIAPTVPPKTEMTSLGTAVFGESITASGGLPERAIASIPARAGNTERAMSSIPA